MIIIALTKKATGTSDGDNADLMTQPSFNAVERVYFPAANVPALSESGVAALATSLAALALAALRGGRRGRRDSGARAAGRAPRPRTGP